MDRLSRLNLSPQTRARFEGLIEEAPALGVSSRAIAAAGLPGLRALLALRQAAESGAKSSRAQHLADLQNAVATLQHRKHFDLVAQLQARATALRGRGSDTEIAHVARGEIVVPREIQTRQVLAALSDALASHNIPLDMLRVGNALNHVNPSTGAPEFGVMNWISGLFGKGNSGADARQNTPFEPVRIVQAPYSPCDPRYIEELEAARADAREFPREAPNPILRGTNAAAEAIRAMIGKGRQPQPPLLGKLGGIRG